MLTEVGVYRKWAAEATNRAYRFRAVERLAWGLVTQPARHELPGTPRFDRYGVHGCGAAIDPDEEVVGLYARPTVKHYYSHTWLMCEKCQRDFFSRVVTDYEIMDGCRYPNPVCGDSVFRDGDRYILERSRADWAAELGVALRS